MRKMCIRDRPSAELQTQISTEKTVSTGDEKLDYFMQKMRERVYASHLTEAKEEQEKNIGAKESKMAALDENPAVDVYKRQALHHLFQIPVGSDCSQFPVRKCGK